MIEENKLGGWNWTRIGHGNNSPLDAPWKILSIPTLCLQLMSKPTYFAITHVSLMCHLSSKYVYLHTHLIIGVKLDLSHKYNYKLYICIVCFVENVDEKWAYVIHYWWHPLIDNNLVVFPLIIIYFSHCTKMTIQTWHAHIFSYWN